MGGSVLMVMTRRGSNTAKGETEELLLETAKNESMPKPSFSSSSSWGMALLGDFFAAKNKELIVPVILVHLNIVVYAAAFWMQQPVLPFLSKELGADEVTFGQLSSTISLL